MELINYKLKKIEGFDKIETREDVRKFLNEMIVEGDVFISVAGKLTFLVRKDKNGNIKSYRRLGCIFDESIELEELSDIQIIKGLYRARRFLNKKFFTN